MADVTISDLNSGTPSNADVIPYSTGTATNKVSVSNLKTALEVPAAQVNSDWNASSGIAQILNKPIIPVVNSLQLAKAWVCFNGQGGVGTNQPIKSSFNVTSVYKNGGGNYTINFTPGTFTNGNIAVVGTFMHVPNVSWGGAAVPNVEPTASSATIFTGDHGRGLVNSAHVSVVFF